MFLSKLQVLADSVAEVASTVSETSTDSGSAGGGLFSRLSPFITIGIFVLIFYFLLIRPEKKRKKEAEDLRSGVKVGDFVVTIGGITGEVTKIGENSLVILSEGSTVKVQKWAIRSVEAGVEEETFTYDPDEVDKAE